MRLPAATHRLKTYLTIHSKNVFISHQFMIRANGSASILFRIYPFKNQTGNVKQETEQTYLTSSFLAKNLTTVISRNIFPSRLELIGRALLAGNSNLPNNPFEEGLHFSPIHDQGWQMGQHQGINSTRGPGQKLFRIRN